MALSRLVGLLEAGEGGEYADLQWFYYFMERSEAMIYSVIQRRRAALLAVDWDIRMVSDGDKGLAREQAELLGHAYDNIDNFREATGFLFSGFFRGFAHVEKHYTESGLIHRLEPVEQWFWVRDGMYGEWEYNGRALSGVNRGERIERKRFVIFESLTGGLNRILSKLFFEKLQYRIAVQRRAVHGGGGVTAMADEFVSTKACGEISTRIFAKLDSIERRLFRDNGTLSIQTRLDRHEQFIRVILWALSVVGGAIL